MLTDALSTRSDAHPSCHQHLHIVDVGPADLFDLLFEPLRVVQLERHNIYKSLRWDNLNKQRHHNGLLKVSNRRLRKLFDFLVLVQMLMSLKKTKTKKNLVLNLLIILWGYSSCSLCFYAFPLTTVQLHHCNEKLQSQTVLLRSGVASASAGSRELTWEGRWRPALRRNTLRLNWF